MVEDGIQASSDIPSGHKIALRPGSKGDFVLKYGQLIGMATQKIHVGDHIHTHNLSAYNREYDAKIGDSVAALENAENYTFEGFVRSHGKVGTRNYIGILTSVNCAATVARRIADYFNSKILSSYPNIDGVVALTHHSGCGQSAASEGIET